MLMIVSLVLVACGSNSKEAVLKKTSNKWTETKGYDLSAQMEIKSGAEPRTYDVNVWHTKPDFYRVAVAQQGEEDSQMIIRNEDGVFVVTPSMKKTYKFQSDWPKQNSQAYLIGALAEDLKADENAKMTETEKVYVFEAKTRNNHSKMLPYQQIFIDKKTLLPTKVAVLNEAKEEQIVITFKKISLGTSRKGTDYAVEDFSKKGTSDKGTIEGKATEEKATEGKATEGKATEEKATEGKASEESTTNKESATSDSDETSENVTENDKGETQSVTGDAQAGAEIENPEFQTHYPVLKWDNLKIIDEKTVAGVDSERRIITYDGGDKSFTVIQQSAAKNPQAIPVFAPGDPADLGFTIGAITDNSISWEKNGVSFFIATNSLSRAEMVEVASSMVNGEVK
ncbi:outer membrane lipoprotein carrier protein LolA [Viridibacillus sp. YIM B01967]|uniref:Outer membrane lipoprotein carrier protein LolA n=1 Tax=Viridibacillus soli TaxID=2798301 RepID=A0ABS1H525_9BACL|nr:outer membrane lipoprotein carrier protein LolA [Viridibacillus soli]